MTLPDTLVSAEWLAANRRPDLHVLDATAVLPAPASDGDYRLESGAARWRDAHIPGSRHADLVGEFSAHPARHHFTRPEPHVLARALAHIGVGEGDDVVLYDTGGGIWAARLWWMLRAIGVPAAVLDGGLEAWRAAGLPVESGDTGAPEPPATPVTPRPGPVAWTDIEDVAAISEGTASGTLVCALGRDQFDGTAPTRYTRRGHIPASLNLPARSLVDPATGLLTTGSALKPLIEAPGPIVVYCGGGISAALLALGLVRAGRADVRVYDGSLEEWTADPARVVATEQG